MPGTPYYDDFYAEDTAWARDRLFEALDRLGAGPGTNDPLTYEDELVPFLPERQGEPPIRPNVVPTRRKATRCRRFRRRGWGGGLVLTDTAIATIDDDFLRHVTEAPPIKVPNSMSFSHSVIAVTADGSYGLITQAWLRIPANQRPDPFSWIAERRFREHPLHPVTKIGTSASYQQWVPISQRPPHRRLAISSCTRPRGRTPRFWCAGSTTTPPARPGRRRGSRAASAG